MHWTSVSEVWMWNGRWCDFKQSQELSVLGTDLHQDFLRQTLYSQGWLLECVMYHDGVKSRTIHALLLSYWEEVWCCLVSGMLPTGQKPLLPLSVLLWKLLWCLVVVFANANVFINCLLLYLISSYFILICPFYTYWAFHVANQQRLLLSCAQLPQSSWSIQLIPHPLCSLPLE